MSNEIIIKFIAQGFAFLATIFIVIGMQQKHYRNIVICKICTEFLSSMNYLLLGGYTGMFSNLASCFTNGCYYLRIKKGKSTLPLQIIFSIMFVGIGLLSWHGAISIFVIAAKLISSIALGIKHPRIIRILHLFSYPCWLVYDIYVVSVISAIADLLSIASVIVGIIRLDLAGYIRIWHKQKNNLSVMKDKK